MLVGMATFPMYNIRRLNHSRWSYVRQWASVTRPYVSTLTIFCQCVGDKPPASAFIVTHKSRGYELEFSQESGGFRSLLRKTLYGLF